MRTGPCGADLSSQDVEIYALQLEAALAASAAYRMKEQQALLRDLLLHNIPILRFQQRESTRQSSLQHRLKRLRARQTQFSTHSYGKSGAEKSNCSQQSDDCETGIQSRTAKRPAAVARAAAAAAAEAAVKAASPEWLFISNDNTAATAVAAVAGSIPPAAHSPSREANFSGDGGALGAAAALKEAAISAAIQDGLGWVRTFTFLASDQHSASVLLDAARSNPGAVGCLP